MVSATLTGFIQVKDYTFNSLWYNLDGFLILSEIESDIIFVIGLVTLIVGS